MAIQGLDENKLFDNFDLSILSIYVKNHKIFVKQINNPNNTKLCV